MGKDLSAPICSPSSACHTAIVCMGGGSVFRNSALRPEVGCNLAAWPDQWAGMGPGFPAASLAACDPVGERLAAMADGSTEHPSASGIML